MMNSAHAALVLIFFLLLCCNALQNGTCNFKVAFIDTADNVSCLTLMNGRDPVCKTGKPTQSCHVHMRDNKTCIKWPADTQLACFKDSDETLNKLNIDKNMCANDQESISCDGEYKSEKKEPDSALTLLPSSLLITAAVIFAVVH